MLADLISSQSLNPNVCRGSTYDVVIIPIHLSLYFAALGVQSPNHITVLSLMCSYTFFYFLPSSSSCSFHYSFHCSLKINFIKKKKKKRTQTISVTNNLSKNKHPNNVSNNKHLNNLSNNKRPNNLSNNKHPNNLNNNKHPNNFSITPKQYE